MVRIYPDSDGDQDLQDRITIYTDGASRGNPGPSAGAFVLADEKGRVIEGKAFFLGETTNNVAEYTGMARALDAAKKLEAKSLQIFSDSELMVRQINGQYKVKSDKLKDLFAECMAILSGFESWQIKHIRRDKNQQADELANKAIDAKTNIALKGKTGSTVQTKPARLGILLSGGGRTMVNIQKHIDTGSINAEIVVVISSLSTVHGVELAKKMGLKLEIVRKKDFADVERFSDRIAEVLRANKVDLVVQAGWLCMWKIPDGYENRVMNIHPALLPSFGGQGMWGHHVHDAVLKAGCRVTGCTVHFCTDEYDVGPIILQRTCEVKDDDDAETLAERVFQQECIAYPEAIDLFAENRIIVKDRIVKLKPHH